MAKKKRDRKIQKSVQINDVSVTSPPYHCTSQKCNTKDSIKNRRKNQRIDYNLCQCSTMDHRPKTREPVTRLYNEDTKKVSDSRDQQSIMLYSPENIDKCPKVKQSLIDHPKSNKKKKYVMNKKSFTRKHKKSNVNTSRHSYKDDKKVKKEPAVQIKFQKKPKLKDNTLTYQEGLGDSCGKRSCTKNLNSIYKPENFKYFSEIDRDIIDVQKNNGKRMKISKKENIMNGHGDQEIVSAEHPAKKICSGSFFDKIKKMASSHKNNKILNTSEERKYKDPLFIMKVDSKEMRVINAKEIKRNVKKYGMSKHKQCICPSRLRNSKDVCDNGICEEGLKRDPLRFSCRCVTDAIECKDATCNLKELNNYHKNKKKYKKVSRDDPLFQVTLDPNMSILNPYEVQDVFTKADNEICPTGICNLAARKRNTRLNCKCINKKIIPQITECTNRTCQFESKSKLSYAWSRVFSKSNSLAYSKKSNAYYKKDGVYINIPHGTKQAKDTDWCECFCECNEHKHRSRLKHNGDSKMAKGKSIIVPKKYSIRKLRKKQPLTIEEYLEQCLRNKKDKCDRKVKRKEKELKKHEKKQHKEQMKQLKKRERMMKADSHNWNCLTSFVSGILNLIVQSVKNAFLAIFYTLTDPIGTFVYMKTRVKDPPLTIKKFFNWLKVTYNNKTTKLSQSVKESHTMNVIADHIEDSAMYDKFIANKGKTEKERQEYERKMRIRKRRIRKRHDEALYGCRHMLLTTLRKTPCLWFYHICPDLYPQCLSLIVFMRNFFHLIVYLLAFLCWTPCIVSYELCRAFLCCFLCTH